MVSRNEAELAQYQKFNTAFVFFSEELNERAWERDPEAYFQFKDGVLSAQSGPQKQLAGYVIRSAAIYGAVTPEQLYLYDESIEFNAESENTVTHDDFPIIDDELSYLRYKGLIDKPLTTGEL